MSNLLTTDTRARALMQEGLLEQLFQDPLFPELQFRAEYKRETWKDRSVEAIRTRTGVITPDLRAIQAMNDPLIGTYDVEQWYVRIAQRGLTVQTDLVLDGLALASLLARDLHTLGLNAGQSMNRLARFPLYNAALYGQARIDTVGGAGVAKHVTRINGFSEAFNVTSRKWEAVSVANPVPARVWNTVTLAWDTVSVTACVPDTAGDEVGPGTLTLAGAYVHVQYDNIVALSASYIVRSGGGNTGIEAIGALDALKLSDIRQGVARLKSLNVPRFEDGYYHAHLSPVAVTQLRNDAEFRLLYRGTGMEQVKDNPYFSGIVAVIEGCVIFENNEAAVPDTIPATYGLQGDNLAAEAYNSATVPIGYALVIGKEAGIEYAKDAIGISEAGITGKIGNWNVTNEGAAIDLGGIQMILRAPIDALMRVVKSSWSFLGAHVVAADYLSARQGSPYADIATGRSRFKRLVTIEHYGA